MLDPLIQNLIDEQQELGGIDIYQLKAGTKLIVKTKNSIYKFTVTKEKGVLWAQGGKLLPHVQKVRLAGSTFGGSILKIGWIGYLMNMELWIDKKNYITTTPVRSAIIQGKDWSYKMEWDVKF